MRGTGAAIRVGVTAILVVVMAYLAFKFVGKGLQMETGYPVWALFHDATGLVDKSRVQIAGLVVGELQERSLYYDPQTRNTLARVTLRIKPDVVLWSNAAIYKRSASLLGEFYLEIDPGTPESPNPLAGRPIANYPLKGCFERTKLPDCNRIKNVIEAVTATDVLAQVNETLPVLRDILRDVHTLTQGPLQDIAREVQAGVKTNSEAAERLLEHVDLIARDLRDMTNPQGPLYEDLRDSLHNVRNITEGIKDLVGTGEGRGGEKIKRDLDQISTTLDKLNRSIDEVNDVVSRVAEGQGTVGKLITDDTIARNITDLTEDTTNFARSIFRLQTLVDVREEYNVMGNSWKTYLSLKLAPRPDKYYLLEFIDDPRGDKTYSHTLQTTSLGVTPTSQINVDTWTRTPAFRFSFMFAKRVVWHGLGFTGRVGLKETTGGVGGDIDMWRERLQLKIDLFDFVAEKYPRLKVAAAVEVLKHFWLVAGVDDVLNQHTDNAPPAGITCGPSTRDTWCRGGFDYFFGAQLSFNDEDLRALLAIGGSAVTGAAATGGRY